jgi:diaminohydroxyphosphoribosylaminopyrimidine deaminase/5-amino-6-(5-phosphoribosylamino)uracil reductase
MALALELAGQGLGRTDPNPMVGAVLVRAGRIIGKGYHRAAGQPHAEVEAIRDAGGEARGADLYVTLEPCNHHGRTPPCTEAILAAGIARVWYGMGDPNPVVRGGGVEFLRSRGLEVNGPVLEDRCRRLNEVFLTHVTLRRPFVYLKLAMSLDGKIATRTGASKWITSDASRTRVHQLRDRVSALMVGVGTVLADNPSLTTRLTGKRGRDPVRIIADSKLRTPVDAEVLNPASAAGAIIGSSADAPLDREALLVERGARIIRTPGQGRVDLADLLVRVYGLGVTSVLIEGGASIAWAALDARLVDRAFFFYAPMIIGGTAAAPGVGGQGVDRLSEAPRLTETETSRVGPDFMITGRVCYPE